MVRRRWLERDESVGEIRDGEKKLERETKWKMKWLLKRIKFRYPLKTTFYQRHKGYIPYP